MTSLGFSGLQRVNILLNFFYLFIIYSKDAYTNSVDHDQTT